MGLTSLGSSGAAAGTPVAGAWSEPVDKADREIRMSHETLSNLGRTVGLAACAYEIADQSAASTLQVKR